jgi:Fic family protein
MHQGLDSLEKFLHDTTPLPYLVRTGIAHAYFETMHPFFDGNGRLGRLLITFMLCQERILRRPLLNLSVFLKKNRTEYYDRLQAVRDSGQWEEWLTFFLRGVAEVAEEATTTARKIVQLREQHRKIVQERMGRGTSRALNLLESLYRQPVVSLSQISDTCDLTFQGASNLAEHFCSLDILKQSAEQKRHRLFTYTRYLAILGEPMRRKGTKDQRLNMTKSSRRTITSQRSLSGLDEGAR